MKDLKILIVLLKENHLVVEQGRLAVHLLDSDPGVPHQHVALAQQPACHLRLRVAANVNVDSSFYYAQKYLHNVAEFDLLLAKFLLVFLQPGLVVLDEEVDGVALGQKCRPGKENAS